MVWKSFIFKRLRLAEMVAASQNYLAQNPPADNADLPVCPGGTGFQPVLHRQDAGATRRNFHPQHFEVKWPGMANVPEVSMRPIRLPLLTLTLLLVLAWNSGPTTCSSKPSTAGRTTAKTPRLCKFIDLMYLRLL